MREKIAHLRMIRIFEHTSVTKECAVRLLLKKKNELFPFEKRVGPLFVCLNRLESPLHADVLCKV